jgi:transposase
MKSRVQDKIQAIALRMEGYSYSQIKERLNVSKSLLSGWLKYVNLNSEQEAQLFQKLRERSMKGVAKAVETNIRRREARETDAKEKASALYEKCKEDRIFIAGLCLYWAEGSKRVSSLQFVNSDHKMIIFMINWFQKYLKIPKEKIFLRLNTHQDFIDENYEDFWSAVTGIPRMQFKKTIYKPNRHGIYKKNPTYKGCMRIEASGGMAMLRKMIYLYEAFISEIEMISL